MPVIAMNEYQQCEWKEGVCAIEGADVVNLLGLSYKIESDDEEIFGQGDEALSIQSGNIKKSGTITVYKSVVDDMQAAAKAAGGRFLTDVKCTITQTYLPAPGRPIMVDTLVGVKFGAMPKGWEQGAKYMKCEIPFKFLRLVTVP